MGWSKGLARRLGRGEGGAVSVESALMFPLLIGIMMMTVEIGFLLFTFTTMQSAARDVTRQIAVNFLAVEAAAEAVAARLPAWSREGLTVGVTQSAPGDPEANVIAVRLTLPAGQATPLGLVAPLAGGFDIAAITEMKQELPFGE